MGLNTNNNKNQLGPMLGNYLPQAGTESYQTLTWEYRPRS
jgi:hypothetical protein